MGLEDFTHNWVKMSEELFRHNLSPEQKEILLSVQNNRRTIVRSGHACGKDFIAGDAALCFLYSYYPSKVICTAPTDRQVNAIMMAEIGKTWRNSKVPLGGELLSSQIKFKDDPDWYLIGFKARDKDIEAWGGFHSPNILIIASEASGLEQETFEAIEGIMVGGVVRLLLIGNPHREIGEFAKSFKSPLYHKIKMSCMDMPNVKAKKILIPGQVDWEYVDEKVKKWCTKTIKEKAAGDAFEWEGDWYNPNDLFRVKVMGEFPKESEGRLVPLGWIEESNARWKERQGLSIGKVPLRLGVDIAGMGRDLSIYTHRRESMVTYIEAFANPDKRETVHMENAGRIKNYLIKPEDRALIDTIGEGAGVHSRCREQGVNSISAKFSYHAKGLKDQANVREFKNMRAYCYWAVRDALDPQHPTNLALPECDELLEELVEITYIIQSDGKIKIEPKEDIQERIGRSPDYADSLALSFYPRLEVEGEDRDVGYSASEIGVF